MSESKNNPRSRGWLVTIPYKYEGNIIGIKYISKLFSKYTYFVMQLEKGGKTEYKHWQVYIEHKNAIYFSSLKKLFPFAHIELREGTMQQAYDYCTKEETRLHGPFEFGDKPDFNDNGSKMATKARLINDIANGLSDFELLMKYPTIYSKRLVEEYRQALGVKDYYMVNNRDVKVYYISGPTRSGKSSFVRRLFDVEDIYVVSDYEKDPFGSYAGQDVIIFEEYRSDFTLSVFLQYLDRYPIMLPARYSNKIAKYTKVFIISNWDFNDQYRFLGLADKKALWSRFSYIFKINKDFIHRFIFDSDSVKKAGSCVNPIGPYGDMFPKHISDFNLFLENYFSE